MPTAAFYFMRRDSEARFAVLAFNVWRAAGFEPPQDIPCSSTEQPSVFKAHFSSVRSGSLRPSRKQMLAVCAFHKMHLNSYGGFHSAAPCPESKCSSAEPMRVKLLFASLFHFTLR